MTLKVVKFSIFVIIKKAISEISEGPGVSYKYNVLCNTKLKKSIHFLIQNLLIGRMERKVAIEDDSEIISSVTFTVGSTVVSF
jgi:hypothetical protein